jgi:hypothetical protein
MKIPIPYSVQASVWNGVGMMVRLRGCKARVAEKRFQLHRLRTEPCKREREDKSKTGRNPVSGGSSTSYPQLCSGQVLQQRSEILREAAR